MQRRQKLRASEVHRRQRTHSGILSEHEVAHIKWRLTRGDSKRAVAEDFCVSLWTIRAIARGDTWAWVEAACMTTAEEEPIVAGEAAVTPEIEASIARFRAMLGETEPVVVPEALPPASPTVAAKAAFYTSGASAKPLGPQTTEETHDVPEQTREDAPKAE